MGKFIQYRTLASLYDKEFSTLSAWPAAGMGDVIVTDNGKLIVIDGGGAPDAEDLLCLIEKCAGFSKPTVELWIITHPHGDHYGALRAISQNASFRERVDVKELLWWFPEDFQDQNGATNIFAGVDARMQAICDVFGAKRRRPARDEEIIIDHIQIRFLYVPDDCSIFGSSGKNSNLCSLIFTVTGSKKSVMITGDAFRPSMQITAFRYGNALKCDALQMPHHALCDSYCDEFYKYVAPDIVFMPISKAGYRDMHGVYLADTGAQINLALENGATTVYKAFDGNAEIEI